MLNRARPFLLSALALTLSGACTGAIAPTEPDETPGDGTPTTRPGQRPAGGGNNGSSTQPPPPPANARPGAGLLPLQRLTHQQYDNTVRDLLGDASRPAAAFGQEAVGGSGFIEPGVVAVEGARKYWQAAEELAATAVLDMAKLTGCGASDDEAACTARFVREFGKRAYRRPLTSEEEASYRALYGALRAEVKHDHRNAIRAIVTAMLQSPFFLYRWELGLQTPAVERATGLVRLDAYQVASRLSYFLWNTMPDAPLFEAAEKGRLATEADVETQARRMLADPRAKDTLESFRVQWLHVEKVPELVKSTDLYKDWSTALAQSMHTEGRRFFEHVLTEGDGKLETLFLADFGFVDTRLAKLYGLTGVDAKEPSRSPLDRAQRAGFLTQAGFLAQHAKAAESHPVKRGLVIHERLLCRLTPPPPDDVPEPRPAAPNLSTRERLAEHGQAACARACHDQFDPLGFALEHYDAVGRFRSEDGGKPVDATGAVTLSEGKRSFANAIELAGILARSNDVRECFARQWLRYGLGRAESDEDEPSLEAAVAGFQRSGFDVRELLVTLTKTRSFLYRRPATGEVTR